LTGISSSLDFFKLKASQTTQNLAFHISANDDYW